jgi:cyclopropane-fatty-acyl-phospholipid synthase
MALTAKETAARLLAEAGIRVGGAKPWDLRVSDEDFYGRVLAEGSMGLGESYMEGWWDCERLDQCLLRLLRQGFQTRIQPWRERVGVLAAKMLNLQRRSRASQVAESHYDIGNDLFRYMLDSRMVYSCGYWKDAQTLDEAQENKLDLVCRKLGLRPGMRVLDIGCGWGSALQFAAERYGVEGVGVTISREQAALARELCAGLPIDIRLQDYRDLDEPFDRILSLGMFEHVGHKNYRAYMRVVARCLQPGGLFLLHTFGGNTSVHTCDPWFHKYIFPNGMVPSIEQVGRAAAGLLVMEDWHGFGPYYDRTLMAWDENFTANWAAIRASGEYDSRFYRMWRYYLLSLAACFRARELQVWQILFAKEPTQNVVRACRVCSECWEANAPAERTLAESQRK